MSRVASIPLQRVMADAIQRSQEKLAVTQQRLSTGKKAVDFSDLGTETVRNLSAHTLLAKQQAQSTVAKRVGTTLQLYDANLSSIETATTDLHKQILSAVGTGNATGMNEAFESAFHTMAAALNANEGGIPLFGGSQTDNDPFPANNLSELTTLTPETAFKNDDVKASARVADGIDIRYGVAASDVGTPFFEAFKTFAQMGKIPDLPTEDQKKQLAKIADTLSNGLTNLRTINAGVGRNQAQVETLAKRGEERGLVLKDVIAGNEDADLGQVALDLTLQKNMLQASYSVFSQLSGLSLVNYLR